MRTSVCTHVTPIIVRLDKSCLGFILQWLLENQKAEENGIGSLESLLTLLKIARQHKMVVFADKQLRLSNNENFAIMQSDLLKILHTQNWKMGLSCFSIVVEDTKATTISEFEYAMAASFIMNCTRTTFPENRQNFMKAIRQFLTKVRITLLKDIRAYVATDTKSEEMERLVAFLTQVCNFCECSLHIDKPIESALPMFEVLKMIQDQFGDQDYKIRLSFVLPALRLLGKIGLLQSERLLIFLLNCLKSSWVLVRIHAYDLLVKFPEDHK